MDAQKIVEKFPEVARLSAIEFADLLLSQGATLTQDQLRACGYVRWSSEQNRPTVEVKFNRATPEGEWKARESAKKAAEARKTNPELRHCCRCYRPYKPGNSDFGCRNHRDDFDSKSGLFPCCGKKTKKEGCVTWRHVTQENKTDEGLMGLSTFERTGDPRDPRRVFAIDTESLYTLRGLEVVSVSIVDHQFQCVYEANVDVNVDDVVDWHTRWSGVDSTNYGSVQRKPLQQVQQEIRAIVSQNDVLIGQALRLDLIGLKLVHETVVDTGELFRSDGRTVGLKQLSADKLGLVIQESDSGGHSPDEDAKACVALMYWWLDSKLKLCN